MSVNRSNIVQCNLDILDARQVYVFPSLEVARFLISCGANVSSVNDNRAVPLHLVAANADCDPQLVNLLISHGSHPDQLDNYNRNPLEILRSRPDGFVYSYLDDISLKCIAARAVCLHHLTYKPEDLPRELSKFVEIHRPSEM